MRPQLHLGAEGGRKQNVMGSSGMAVASVMKPDGLSSWEEVIEDSTQSVCRLASQSYAVSSIFPPR